MESVKWPVDGRFPRPELEIAHRDVYADSPYTCFTICDPVYFRHYADRFISTLREQCGRINVFLLLVNPDDDIVGDAVKYSGMTVGITKYDGRWLFEFTTAARFILARDILGVTNGPTVFMDVDSVFRPGSAEIMSKMSRYPLAFCDTGKLWPILCVSAANLAAYPSQTAFSFFDAAGDFMREDLTREGPLWGFDQTGLYRAVCLGKKVGWEMTEINSILEGTAILPDFFTLDKEETIPLNERIALRTNAHYLYRGISTERKLYFATGVKNPR
jgi:hypothetical protein